jgi:hypothetical protein
MIRALIIGCAALWLGACAGRGGSVHGSVGEVYDLRFDVVRARLYETELALEYARSDGAVPVRVSVSRVALESGRRELALGVDADVGGTTRDGSTMPSAESGTVRLDRFDPWGGDPRVRGSFDARIPTTTAVLELVGDFDLPLEIVDWDGARGPLPASDGGGGERTGADGGV